MYRDERGEMVSTLVQASVSGVGRAARNTSPEVLLRRRRSVQLGPVYLLRETEKERYYGMRLSE